MTTTERFRWVRTKLRRLFRRGQQEAAMDAEMQFHFDQLVAEFRASGLSEAAAHRAALREFGTTDAYREEMRDTWRWPALADLWRDLRFAARSLLRTPGFALLAILTLGLGVGVNTAMFSVVNGVALKPLPYRDADQVDRIYRRTSAEPTGALSVPDYREFRAAASSIYSEIAGFSFGDVSLADEGQPAQFASGMRVSAEFFQLLGLPPVQGRAFQLDETQRGNDAVVILSNRLWQNNFGSRPDILGQQIRIDGRAHTVVGVMPATFNEWRHWGWVDLFRPLAFSTAAESAREQPTVGVIARRAPDIDAATANAFVSNFGERLARDYPELHAESAFYTRTLPDTVTGFDTKITLSMLLGLSGFVVLIACSNLANFLLARTMARSREHAVRAALGASRAQLLRPLLAESLLLALAGSALAVVCAIGASDWLRVRSTGDNGEQVIFALDWSVLGWALLCSLLTAIAFGLAPSLFTLRLDLNNALKSGGRGTTGSRRQNRLRHLLIVGQFALAMVLLTGSAVFVSALSDLNERREGWDSERLVTGTFLLPEARYDTPDAITAFQDRALERLRALPGVNQAAFSTHPPFFSWSETRRFIVDRQERPAPGREPAAVVNVTTPDYLATVQTPLLSGRDFALTDRADSTPVMLINADLAQVLFGNADPLGQRLAFVADGSPQWIEVVGVVGNVRNSEAEAASIPHQVYLPMAQRPAAYHEIAVRTASGNPDAMVPAIRSIFTELDPDLPIRDLKSADQRIARFNYQVGVLRDMLTAFATLGTALAAIGIFGVITRTMAQRRHEFGVRLALGAQVSDITRLVLGSGVRLALTGAIIGLVGGVGLSKLLAIGFPNMDLARPAVMAFTALGLIGIALLACYLPARRASRIDPVESLRAE
ncbi:ABC transporter permease [Actomonas aquatica]|uniref:ABC transporter permease n=1 Tax=Actomonas aquatica TaxID=2866162 RepID=A0ABZ1C6T0_9BACT|nr:ABC transporter permease [Opitutus sp. WL0086]WRQ87432.1 ABC transporter permease [Opitutus sp. WL0086]